MIITDARLFKNELQYYNYYLEKVKGNRVLLNLIEKDLYSSTPSPLQYDRYYEFDGKKFVEKTIFKQKGSFNPELKNEMTERLEKERERVLGQIRLFTSRIQDIKDTWDILDRKTQIVCKLVYIDGNSFEKTCDILATEYEKENLFYSRQGLQKFLNTSLDKALKKVS